MAAIDNLPIKIDESKIAAFCRGHGISRLSLFGSVLRDDFDPAHTDVDILVEFLWVGPIVHQEALALYEQS